MKCNYSFVDLEKTVQAGLDSASPTTVRRFAGRSGCWIDAYIDGLDTSSRPVLRDKKDHIVQGWVRGVVGYVCEGLINQPNQSMKYA